MPRHRSGPARVWPLSKNQEAGFITAAAVLAVTIYLLSKLNLAIGLLPQERVLSGGAAIALALGVSMFGLRRLHGTMVFTGMAVTLLVVLFNV